MEELKFTTIQWIIRFTIVNCVLLQCIISKYDGYTYDYFSMDAELSRLLFFDRNAYDDLSKVEEL